MQLRPTCGHCRSRMCSTAGDRRSQTVVRGSENADDIVGESLNRRAALRRAAAAGAVVWTAPTVLSQSVSAADGTFTPKCEPTTTPAIQSSSDRTGCYPSVVRVSITIGAPPGAVLCPCSTALVDAAGPETIGTPTLGYLTLTSTTPSAPSAPGTTFVLEYTGNPAGFPSQDVPFDALVMCTDRAGDTKTNSYPTVESIGAFYCD